ALYRQAVDHGNADALYRLVAMREQAGDREGADALYRQAVDHGNADALYRLVAMREQAGDRDGAEALARQAADHGNPNALYRLAEEPGVFTMLWPYGLDPDGTPTSPWRASVSIERSRHVPPGTS
ncbi:hypothetical protein ACFWCB_10140, partial [Streptomyces sp. NPDC060048]